MLPTQAEHPDVRDIDGDGQPGFTVVIEGLVSGEVRLVRRERLRFAGSVDKIRMRGEPDLTVEQNLLSASTSLLETPIPETVRGGTFRGVRTPVSGCKGAFRGLEKG